jgi:hypothetical protein
MSKGILKRLKENIWVMLALDMSFVMGLVILVSVLLLSNPNHFVLVMDIILVTLLLYCLFILLVFTVLWSDVI